MFRFQVGPRQITVREYEVLVSNSVNTYPCIFEFDKSWNGFTKTAVFVTDGLPVAIELLNSELTCEIPWELLSIPGKCVHIGCFGLVGEEIVRRTTFKTLGIVKMGATDGASPERPPSPNIYEQLQAEIGDLSSLMTESKNNLVAAINETYTDIPSRVTQLENDAPYIDQNQFNQTVGNIELLLSKI